MGRCSKMYVEKFGLFLILTTFTLMIRVVGVNAASIEDLRKKKHEHVKSLNKSESSAAASLSDAKSKAKKLGLDQNNELRVLREITDQKGITHSRLRQYYQGVPIFGHHIIVASEDGDATRVNGQVVKGIAADVQNVTPAFDARSALSLVREAGIYTENEETELTIYVGDDGVARLAYFVSFFEATSNPTRPHFIIDATSGDILKQWDGLTHDKIGQGPGGNLKTGKYEYGTDLDFFDVEVSGAACAMHTDNVKTTDVTNQFSPPFGNAPEFPDVYSYGCPENTYRQANGGYAPLNDGHFFSSQVHDMYTNWYGVPPLDMQLLVRVHYGTSYDNAFWNGSSITFGDGSDDFYPLVGLDIVSHEVAHGFTEQNSDLIYASESGGINEAFSDMAGEAAELYLNGSNDFKVGFDIRKGPGALRYMNDPPLDGRSIDHTDDYFEGLDVHLSSGIFNKAFYLIATAPSWDTHKAFNIFVKANQENWTPGVNFVDAAAGVIDAAVDLDYDPIPVIDAFEAVGVAIFKQLSVVIPEEVTEGVAGQIVVATATVTPAADFNRSVFFYSDDENEIIVPESVPLPAGVIEVSFNMEIVNDGLLDGTKTPIIRVRQAKQNVYTPVMVHDAATANLTVSIPASATEGDGVLAGQGTVTVSTAVDTDATISLSSDDTRESTVPAFVVILAGQTSATFDVNIVDDIFDDGTQNANITASVANWSAGSDSIAVADNDSTSPVVTVVLPDDGFEHGKTQFGAGTVSLSSAVAADATVSLSSTDTSELTVDSSVVIAAGQSSATFDITLVEDAVLDGTRSVTVNASIDGLIGSDSLDVVDNEPGIFGFANPYDFVNRSSGEHEVKVVRLYGSRSANLSYATSDVNATAGEDYTSASGTLSFAAGDTEKSFVVPVAIDADLVFEKDADFFVGIGEDFEISLSNPGGINPAPGNVVIIDDLVVYQYIDPLVTFAKVAKTMDMDGDGDLDIYGAAGDLPFFPEWGDRGTAWWENLGGPEGMNQYSPHHVIDANFIDPLSLHAVDLDGDGEQDMLASDNAEIKVWINLDGSATSWSAGQTISLLADPLSFPADMDGDGDMDIVGVEFGGIYWWENLTGAGTTWSEHFVDFMRMHNAGHGLTVGDIDGDGDMDITRGYHWWENLDGSGLSWEDGVFITDGAGHVDAVYLADMDGDEDLDVVTANPVSYASGLPISGGTIWYENPDSTGGTGVTAWPSHDVIVPGEFFRFDLVWPSDIDQDGDMDLVGGSFDSWFVGWKENLDGTGTSWDDHTVYHTYADASSVYSGDIDGDGDIDIVATASFFDEVSWFKNPSNDFVDGGYRLSRYADFSEDNILFNRGTSMYTKVWGNDVDFTDIKQAYYEIEVGNVKLKGNLINHQNGYFTEAIDVTHFSEGVGKIKKLKLEDHDRKKLEVKDVAIEIFEHPLFNSGVRYWKLSKNADFSTDDTEFSASDTLYLWIHSPVIDHNDMKKAEFEVTQGKKKVKANLTNNFDGTFTGSISLSQFGSGAIKLKKLKIEDNTKAKYEIKDVDLTVVP